MGGGVGNALSSITTYSINHNNNYKHKILILESPQKTQFIDICRANNIDVVYATDIETIKDELIKADIVQLSWWHHPIMAKLLSDFPKIPIRLIIWAHISGCNYPYIPFDFSKIPHKMLFTTKYSFENPYWNESQKEYIRMKADIIYGAGDLSVVEKAESIPHDCFNIGYIGTLNYSKINPEFVKYCAVIDIPDVKFIMVGDSDNKDLIEDTKKYNVDSKIEFKGYVKDITRILSNIDVFGYPLNPCHFGTTENVILEAMAAAIPVVALNQGAEKYIIDHMKTGLLADNIEHYGQIMKYLYENPDERKRIGKNAKEYVMETFSLEKTLHKMNSIYDEVISYPKKEFCFNDIFGDIPYEWFLACLGEYRKIFEDSINKSIMADKNKCEQIEKQIFNCPHILREKSKSSICQFYEYFPKDKILSYWNSIVNNVNLE